jgi:hypothetical protein
MTRNGAILAVMGAGMFAAMCLAWPSVRLAGASQREQEAAISFQRALEAEREVVALRSTVTSSLLSKPPDGDVAAAIQASLRDVGLSVQLLAEVSPQESVTIQTTDASSARWKRQSVTVRMQAMPLPDIGSFLDRWRAAHPEWTIGQIDLQGSEGRTVTDGSSGGMFAARLTLLTTYLDRAEP